MGSDFSEKWGVVKPHFSEKIGALYPFRFRQPFDPYETFSNHLKTNLAVQRNVAPIKYPCSPCSLGIIRWDVSVRRHSDKFRRDLLDQCACFGIGQLQPMSQRGRYALDSDLHARMDC